ncbi:MAG: GNAT family N-acetyltransferase [Acidimicrobiales bacterium]
MSFEIRPITDDDWPAFIRTDQAGFGMVPNADLLDPARRPWPLDRSVATFEDGEVVGCAAAYPMELTLPGLRTEPCAGVTYVSVLPTHRRRGVLSGMMRHQLADIRERGEVVASLLASESVIYGRFGYGLATRASERRIDRRHTQIRAELDREVAGRVRLLDADDARKVLPDVHDRSRAQQPGDMSRTDGWWSAWFRRPKEDRFFAVYESAAGEAEGFAVYKVKPGSDWLSSGTVQVAGLVSASADAYLALWRYVCDIDLTNTIELSNRPVAEPMEWMLVDHRRLETSRQSDFLWIRLVDLAAALGARTYATDDRFVIEVVGDPLCPWNEGRWALDTGREGGSCARSTDEVDLTVPVTALGAAYLGGSSLAEMARAGLVSERAPGIAARADSALRTDPGPWCQTHF